MKTSYKIIFILMLFNVIMAFYYLSLNNEVELQTTIIKYYEDKELEGKKQYEEMLAKEPTLRISEERISYNDSLSIIIGYQKTIKRDSVDVSFRLFHNINTSYNEVYVNGELVEEQYFPHKYEKEISDIDVAIINPVEGGSIIKLKYKK